MEQTDQRGQEVNMCLNNKSVPSFLCVLYGASRQINRCRLSGRHNEHKPVSSKQVEELFKTNTPFEATPQQKGWPFSEDMLKMYALDAIV
ncbi:hypothetical protein QQF64_031792 [Cirrhinus molitorella]|uniref:Uncharacterized protein n=1 Tax=Cirrhinus molitorella TaxID=172907 RepID=A0ABR3MXY2_9TELE